jgi:hypothetical protein
VSDLLTREGTRIVLLSSNTPGVIVELRRETFLKPYVVLRDDGTKVFVSACDLAREDDPDRTPLGPAIER